MLRCRGSLLFVLNSWCVADCTCVDGLGFCFFFQAEDGIRVLVRSRGLGDVYKRQVVRPARAVGRHPLLPGDERAGDRRGGAHQAARGRCLLYTSDAADERSSVDLGGRRIIKKKKTTTIQRVTISR